MPHTFRQSNDWDLTVTHTLLSLNNHALAFQSVIICLGIRDADRHNVHDEDANTSRLLAFLRINQQVPKQGDVLFNKQHQIVLHPNNYLSR